MYPSRKATGTVSDAVLISLIGGGVTVITALISILAYYIRIRLAQKHPTAVVPEDEEERVAEERYANDPRAFIADIMDDRKQYREEVKGYREEVAGLRRELSDFRDKDRKFRNALARWMLDILDAWGLTPAMPYPREDDREILAEVIPTALEATRPRDNP